MKHATQPTAEQKGKCWDLLHSKSLAELRASAKQPLQGQHALQLAVIHKVARASTREEFVAAQELGDIAVKLSSAEMEAMKGGLWWAFWNVVSNGWGVESYENVYSWSGTL